MGARFSEMAIEAGLPPGVFNFVTGPGSTVGQELIDNDGIDGIVFTGSKEVGLKLMRDNAARAVPRPLIIEMGGKNPAIITRSADIDKATDGVMRSAFGAQGQKCSACSRVYIQKDVRDAFVRLLVEKTKRIKVGNPLERDVWMGPVINEGAVKTYLSAIERAKEDWWKDPDWRKTDHRAAVRSRVLRRADDHRRSAVRACAVLGGAVRSHHGRRRRADARRSARSRQSDRVRADGGHLLGRRERAAANFSSGFKRGSPTPTAVPARRPAHGLVSTRSAVGRPAGRPAAELAARTTCNNSCASRAGFAYAASKRAVPEFPGLFRRFAAVRCRRVDNRPASTYN